MFEKIVETISATGKTVSEKTKQGSEYIRLSRKAAAEEKALTDLFLEIGMTYFENNAENPCCDDMKALFDKVIAKKSEIEDLKAQVRAIKGVVVCSDCGAEAPIENDFCGKCGCKLDKPVVEEPCCEEEADHEETVEDAVADVAEDVVPDVVVAEEPSEENE